MATMAKRWRNGVKLNVSGQAAASPWLRGNVCGDSTKLSVSTNNGPGEFRFEVGEREREVPPLSKLHQYFKGARAELSHWLSFHPPSPLKWFSNVCRLRAIHLFYRDEYIKVVLLHLHSRSIFSPSFP